MKVYIKVYKRQIVGYATNEEQRVDFQGSVGDEFEFNCISDKRSDIYLTAVELGLIDSVDKNMGKPFVFRGINLISIESESFSCKDCYIRNNYNDGIKDCDKACIEAGLDCTTLSYETMRGVHFVEAGL